MKAKRPERTLTLKATSGFGGGVEESNRAVGVGGWVFAAARTLALLYSRGHGTVLLLGRGGGRRRRRDEAWRVVYAVDRRASFVFVDATKVVVEV